MLISKAFAYKIDLTNITVSGISSGAYMAGQFHLAYSSSVKGVALIAGGPYFCSQGRVSLALNQCMSTKSGPIDVLTLVSRVFDFQQRSLIDPVTNLKDSKVYLLSGRNDSVVDPSIVMSNKYFYEELGIKKFKSNFDLKLGHAFPTKGYGNTCSAAAVSPYLSACDFDAVGDFFNFFYSDLKPALSAREGSFIRLSQEFEKLGDPFWFSMADEAIAYIPKYCRSGAKCKLHIAFHGCEQGEAEVSDAFYKNAGYNKWASSNNIIVLYPQAISRVYLGNPNGCWDWWGYTNSDFANKRGKQVRAVKYLIQKLKNL